MDNLSYIIGLNNGEGGGGASSWSDIDGKPFNTVGTGLTVTAGKTLTTDGTFVTETALTTALTPYVDTTALTTALTPYVDYASMETALTPYAESANLATVATSGNYADLSNKPSIPDAVSVSQTLQSGTAIADITIGDTTTTLYAPSGGGSVPFSSIGNGLTVTAGGALQEAVPVYSESIVVPGKVYGPGLIVETTISAGNWDFDYTQEMPSNSYLSFTYETDYYVTANIDDEIYSGLWNTGLQGNEHSYGGFSWEVYNKDNEYVDTWEFYIENEEYGDFYQRFHIYPNGMECDHLYWFIIEPVDPLTEQNLTEANVELYNYTWGSKSIPSHTETVYHKLPLDYTSVNADGVLWNDSGIIKGYELYGEDEGHINITKSEEEHRYYFSIEGQTDARKLAGTGLEAYLRDDGDEPYLSIKEAVPVYSEINWDNENLECDEDHTEDVSSRLFYGGYSQYVASQRQAGASYTVYMKVEYQPEIDGEWQEADTVGYISNFSTGGGSFDANSPCLDYGIDTYLFWDTNGYQTMGETCYMRVTYCWNIFPKPYYDLKVTAISIKEIQQNEENFPTVDYRVNIGIIYHKLPNDYVKYDNETIKINASGNLSSVIPAVTTTAGTYNLQAVVDANGVPTYSWVAQV